VSRDSSDELGTVLLFALADYSLPEHQTIENFSTREEAEAALRAILADEPGWAGSIGVVEFELETGQN
jgi:hypothetical protein